MALTKDFRETIRERAQREPVFRKALLSEAIELMLSGDERTGRAILRNYINATVGFPRLEQATTIPATKPSAIVQPVRSSARPTERRWCRCESPHR